MLTITTNTMTIKEPRGGTLCTPACVRGELEDMATMAQEGFCVLTVNAKNTIIDRHLVTIGTLDAVSVHPREVFKAAIWDGAAAIVLAHNHPSGDPTPSAEDIKITRQLVDAGKTLDVKVLDHVILGRGNPDHISLREAGLVKF